MSLYCVFKNNCFIMHIIFFTLMLYQKNTAYPPQLETKVAQTINQSAQLIQNLFDLYIATSHPRITQLLSQQEIQELKDLLEQAKTIKWQRYYEWHHKLNDKQTTHKSLTVDPIKQKLTALENEYADITRTMDMFFGKNLPEQPTTINISTSRIKEYIDKRNAIFKDRPHIAQEKKESKIPDDVKAAHDILTKLSLFLTKTSQKLEKISADKDFWFAFLHKALEQLTITLPSLLTQELSNSLKNNVLQKEFTK